MTLPKRPPILLHCTSEPYQFFGREAELALLDSAFSHDELGVVAMVGPGGQGKTAIAQSWLQQFVGGGRQTDGVFLWSFYRGKDADLCIREMYRYAQRMDELPDLSAGYCVDRLLDMLRNERWAIVLDGTEIVQHESGSWRGRFVHPELGRLLEEIASEPFPGVVVVTSRFELPTLTKRKHAQLLSLSSLDKASAVALLKSLGVRGNQEALQDAAAVCGHHAKAVELLGTWLVHFCDAEACRHSNLPPFTPDGEATEEENNVSKILGAFHEYLPSESQDIVALATSFRQPPTESQLLDYLNSASLHHLLHESWRRQYQPFNERPRAWTEQQLQFLVDLRLLERVHGGRDSHSRMVIDAHPLVRRGFEHLLGGHENRREHAKARAGFLSGRPDRRPPKSISEAREEVELFHAYCDAGMWNEADSVYVALDNPKHRFLAPAFERDLLLRFFPQRDHTANPLWHGFGRYRSLAICLEMLGEFEQAVETYRESDFALRGDAYLALGRLTPFLNTVQVDHPWQNLWQAYRAHALCLAGESSKALSIAKSLVPIDVYEWVHVFECLLRTNHLDALDLNSLLYRPPHSKEHLWSQLARQRMKLDYLRITKDPTNLESPFRELIEEYDRGGLLYERALTRLSLARMLTAQVNHEPALSMAEVAVELARRYSMKIILCDALELCAELEEQSGMGNNAAAMRNESAQIRSQVGYRDAPRP